MTAQEQYEAAKNGKYFVCIFFPRNLLKIRSVEGDFFTVQIMTVSEKELTSGLGKVNNTIFSSWYEHEKIDTYERGFQRGEYVLADENDLKRFKSPVSCE